MTDTEPPAISGDEEPRPDPGDVDEQFAVRLREERERKRWSQADVARQMTERGWGWHPQTVQKIENGHRKVSVGEGKVLAEIFGTTIDRLTMPGRQASAAWLLATYTARAETAMRQIGDWTSVLLHSQSQLELTVSGVERDGYFGSEEIRGLADEARDAMQFIPGDAVAEVVRGEIADEDPAPMRAEEGA